MTFNKVCTLSDIPVDKGLKVRNGEISVAIFKVEGEVLATQDYCSHGLWSLTDIGYIDGNQIVCPIHMGKFCARSGRATAIPAHQPLKKYSVRVEGENVFIAFD